MNAVPVRAEPSFDDCAMVVERACARIAPNWPLDQLIAVNPFWGWIGMQPAETAAQLEAHQGSRLLMPRAWYREQWRAGRFSARHLLQALESSAPGCTVDEITAQLAADEPQRPQRALMTDVADAQRDLAHHMRWTDFVTHHISQLCASYFDAGQAQLRPSRERGLYAVWLDHAVRDHSPSLLMRLSRFRSLAQRLPQDARALIVQAVAALKIPPEQQESYFTGLLLSINGWAAWCAYLRWQAHLAGRSDDHILELLAIRLAWECLLHDSVGAANWSAAVGQWAAIDAQARASQASEWVVQDALEIAYQERLARELTTRAAAHGTAPQVQAVFCIDVRSEVFRRSLEAASVKVQTLGFAGFFGLFIDYQPLGAPDARPQLPGLLAPQLRVADSGVPTDLAQQRGQRLQTREAWNRFKTTPVSGFSFVEALGPLYMGKLAAHSFARTSPLEPPDRAGLKPQENALRKPRLVGPIGGGTLSPGQLANAAARMLRSMSLTRDFARLVVFVGHGSQTANNPLGAALDCGACCGQTGEVNARAAAALLNDRAVRQELSANGIVIPATTHFLPALHNTTTDEVALFDLDELPSTHRSDVQALQDWLQAAGARSRGERAGKLSISEVDDRETYRSMAQRARDWSQVRPEWGLANCAAFIVAPREHCSHIDLAGRAFLHDYRWQDDADFSVLELVMTAPMVVTHWINMQYYASTVDNRHWGSGNKVLHNVVGARIGVFEGNGGDLRIGLPMQSLHDGQRFMHEPLRLSVFIEAPRDAMDAVIGKHATVRHLVDNAWLHLFQFDPQTGTVHKRTRKGWTHFGPATGA